MGILHDHKQDENKEYRVPKKIAFNFITHIKVSHIKCSCIAINSKYLIAIVATYFSLSHMPFFFSFISLSQNNTQIFKVVELQTMGRD